jgi:hypothetical protein
MTTRARTLPILLATTVLCLACAPAAGAAQPKGKCRGGTTVASNSVARLYEKGQSLFGCLWSDNERIEIDSEYDDDFTLREGYMDARLGGRFVAWTHWAQDVSCKADCPPGYDEATYTVNRIDLKTERTRTTPGVPAGATLRVNKRGAITWLERLGGGVRDLHAWDADGHRVLDTGPISSRTYSLGAASVRWVNGGEERSAPLR